MLDWDLVTAMSGVFDGEPHEDFEDGWRSNDAYASSWASVPSSIAMFNTGVQDVEDFHNGWTAAESLWAGTDQYSQAGNAWQRHRLVFFLVESTRPAR